MTLQWNTTSGAGSVWRRAFTFTNEDDGTLIDLTGLAWEFVVRKSATDTSDPPLVKVTLTPGAQGQIIVDLPTATVTVSLTPAATAPLGKGARPLALWSDPDDPDNRLCWVEGVFNTVLVAVP